MKWILLFTKRKKSKSATIKDHLKINLAKNTSLSTASYNFKLSKAISKYFR